MKRHDGLEKLVMEGKIDGKRKQGRPRKTWDEDIVEWTKRNVADCGRLALNRVGYRQLVQAATSRPG